LSFTGVCNKQDVLLSWSTATEENNKYYSIQHSKNGINWKVIGKIIGAGNSTEVQHYSYTDKEIYNSASYYRLSQTDFDEKSKFFKTIAVKNCREEQIGLTIYSTAGSEIFNLLLTGNKTQVLSILVYNSSGKKIFQSAGYQQAIDLSGKPAGTYFVQCRLSTSDITRKFIKLK
jgi:hypothetical protein